MWGMDIHAGDCALAYHLWAFEFGRILGIVEAVSRHVGVRGKITHALAE